MSDKNKTQHNPSEATTAASSPADNAGASAPAAAADGSGASPTDKAEKEGDKATAATKQERKDLAALANRTGQKIDHAFKTADGFTFLQRGHALSHARTLDDDTIIKINV